ncbi:Hypothetical predicted protein [Paramuricea clavata]|uniref:Uncharacterized protein n=1 Tax=Paramuricea clavata TaxID=317549 RepID=A0A7D9HKI9_PARCT|nr:Hypothetical predicted protein [Paramuricea clavata]
MTTLVVGGIFNAVALAGAEFLISKLNNAGYKKYTKNIIKLSKYWRKPKKEKEMNLRNDEQRRREEILSANKDIEELNRDLEELRNFTKLTNDTAQREMPKLGDFYKPSDEMKNMQW